MVEIPDKIPTQVVQIMILICLKKTAVENFAIAFPFIEEKEKKITIVAPSKGKAGDQTPN